MHHLRITSASPSHHLRSLEGLTPPPQAQHIFLAMKSTSSLFSQLSGLDLRQYRRQPSPPLSVAPPSESLQAVSCVPPPQEQHMRRAEKSSSSNHPQALSLRPAYQEQLP
eukprot:CAMPEP_0170644108 /NCGR_PEP_ID=MMETSP0224-20130122/42287_1 /TAXON_ID=285029 /ORGANISM="Togula jolla, Strain CCCM 725" /LENGTH=109 /DNA_ID=CAMNT_0010975069 /DNA_START=165 /DNA_END=494 /DNA_ORIENTATION=+